MTEEQIDDSTSDLQQKLEKAVLGFNEADSKEQWNYVALYREEGELIINNDGTFFKLEEDGLSVELKLKEQCSMETLLRTFGFNYKINTND